MISVCLRAFVPATITLHTRSHTSSGQQDKINFYTKYGDLCDFQQFVCLNLFDFECEKISEFVNGFILHRPWHILHFNIEHSILFSVKNFTFIKISNKVFLLIFFKKRNKWHDRHKVDLLSNSKQLSKPNRGTGSSPKSMGSLWWKKPRCLQST